MVTGFKFRFASPSRIDSCIASNKFFGCTGRSGITLSVAFKFEIKIIYDYLILKIDFHKHTFFNSFFVVSKIFLILSESRFSCCFCFRFATFDGLCGVIIRFTDSRLAMARTSLVNWSTFWSMIIFCVRVRTIFTIMSQSANFEILWLNVCTLSASYIYEWTGMNLLYSNCQNNEMTTDMKCLTCLCERGSKIWPL